MLVSRTAIATMTNTKATITLMILKRMTDQNHTYLQISYIMKTTLNG